MSDLITFVLGALLVFAIAAAWKALGPLRERARSADAAFQSAAAPSLLRLENVEGAVATLQAQVRDLISRQEKQDLALRGTIIEVMDKAEKVAARLQDRERKRNGAAGAPAQEFETDAEWWERTRKAYPLPGMPTQDPAQLSFVPDQDAQ